MKFDIFSAMNECKPLDIKDACGCEGKRKRFFLYIKYDTWKSKTFHCVALYVCEKSSSPRLSVFSMNEEKSLKFGY